MPASTEPGLAWPQKSQHSPTPLLQPTVVWAGPRLPPLATDMLGSARKFAQLSTRQSAAIYEQAHVRGTLKQGDPTSARRLRRHRPGPDGGTARRAPGARGRGHRGGGRSKTAVRDRVRRVRDRVRRWSCWWIIPGSMRASVWGCAAGSTRACSDSDTRRLRSSRPRTS